VNIIQKLYALFSPAAPQPSKAQQQLARVRGILASCSRRGRKPLAYRLTKRQIELAKGWEGNTNKLSKKLRCSWQAAQRLRDTAHR